jgi:hypothetical protein
MADGASIDAEIELVLSPSAKIGVNADVAHVELDVALDIGASLPGLTLEVDHVVAAGVIKLHADADGTLRFVPGFKLEPPTGARAQLDVSGISGGGYLRHTDNPDEWSGALAADLGPASVTGLFILGHVHGATSFVAVLGIRFSPGIQLSFGFELTGIGGLVGINRSADVDQLRQRLAGGAAGNVLFCEDPIANAPTILGDLDQFFPATAGKLIVGPTLQISWLAPIVRLDVAVLVEVPGPAKIIVLGTLRVLIGANENVALLFLRMDFLGVFDLEQQLVSIDAQLVNSHALGVFRLTGGMAFRMFYGSNPYVLLSIGGFHPRFDPGPLNLPVIPRVGAVLDLPAAVGISLRLELYTAFTPNTLQAGALVQAGMNLGPLGVEGSFRFDGLVTFKPFTFDIEFAAGLAVKVFGESFCSVGVSGHITGPGPLVVSARASVKVLLVRVHGSATFQLGQHNGDSVVAVASIVDALAGELSNPRNLHTEGNDPNIRLRTDIVRPADGVALVLPTGALIWKQKRAPLDTTIDRFEGAPIGGGPNQVHVTVPAGAQAETEWFSPGSFTTLDLKASQTLNNAGFELLPGGLRVSGAASDRANDTTACDNKMQLVKVPTTEPPILDLPVLSYLSRGLAEAVFERDTTPPIRGGAAKVTVIAETFDVMGADGTPVHQGRTAFQAFQLSRQTPGAVALASHDVSVPL